MKKHIIFFTFIFIFAGCEKLQVQDDNLPIMYISEPKELTPTGVSFFGDVEESEFRVETIGFCWGENPMPTIDDSKALFNVDSDYYFHHRIENLKPDTEYYFRTRGTTIQGIGYSEDAIVRTPPVATPPCEIEESKMLFGSYEIDYPNLTVYLSNNQYADQYIMRGTSQGARIELFFSKTPETRIYQSIFVINENDKDRPVSKVTGIFPPPIFPLSLYGNTQLNNTEFYAESGQPIYIEKLEGENHRIEFCDFKMISEINSNITFNFNGHFITE